MFSEDRILAIKEITKIDSRYGYNFLEEIVVRRHDDKLYTFSEADFHRLNLDDLFDMYLLKLQGKLEHLSGTSQYDIVNSILQYVRQAILKARVEDAQLGVESYQRTLNFTEPHTQPTGMHKQKLLTFNRKPFGV